MASQSAIDQLWEAAEGAGDADRVRQLFQTSALKPEDAQEVLEVVLMEGVSADVARALLENGASAKSISATSLRKCRSVELFRLMAENGVDFKDDGHLILEDVVHSREIVDFLLDQGVDINRPNEDVDSDGRRLPPMAPAPGSEGLFDRALGVLNNTAALGDIDLFDHLVSRGADVTKSIALHTATRCPDPVKTKAMISHLIEKYGFDPNADDNATGLRHLSMNARDYGVPLRFAFRHQNLAAVEALLQHGADPSFDDNLQVKRAISEFPPAVEPLLAAGADATVALDKAAGLGDLEIAKLCLKHGANPSKILDEVADHKREISPDMLALLKG